eukprot:c24540_g1_i2 orf=413-1045(+)
MAKSVSSAPVDLVFAMGETEKKMDMTLDEIIKMSKKKGKKARTPIKDLNRNFFRGRARPSLQRSFFSRISSLRQEKLAQARGQNGNGNGTFLNTEVFARKPLFSARTNRRRRNSRKFPRRFPLSYATAAGKMKISVTNVATKNGARALSVGYRKDFAFGHLGAASSKMEANYQQKKLRTLDSLFANLKQRTMRSLTGSQGLRKGGNWLGN